MRALLIMILATSFAAAAAFGQEPVPAQPVPRVAVETRTLESILEELRHLRQDLQSTTAVVERMQLLLYRMRNQMDIVSRVSQKWEQAHQGAEQTVSQRTMLANQIKHLEENLNSITEENARHATEERIAEMKSWLAQLDAGQPELLAREAEAANELRLENDKLNELQDEIDRLDRKLEVAAVHP